jgi:hypothetical protein
VQASFHKQYKGKAKSMTIRSNFLLAAGSALVLALPAVAMAQADQAGQTATKSYPPCSATVTDSCMQHHGSHAKGHSAKPVHHKAHKKG